MPSHGHQLSSLARSSSRKAARPVRFPLHFRSVCLFEISAAVPGGGSASLPTVKRFASAGCDNLVKIWGFREDTEKWVEEEVLDGHTDWVRDVAWAPNIGLPRSYIATASQDKTVIVWTKDSQNAPWHKTVLDGGHNGKFADVVWRVSWSLAGNILAVSCGDGKVTLWKENLRGAWECVSEMNA